MPRMRGGLLHLGIKGHVVAVDRATGQERWRTKLEGVRVRTHDFVHLYRDGDALLASYSGEVFCLDPESGELRWHNQLTGLGTGIVTMVGATPTDHSAPASLLEDKRRRDAAAATAAT